MSKRNQNVVNNVTSAVGSIGSAVGRVANTIDGIFEGAEIASSASTIHAHSFLRKTQVRVLAEEAEEMAEMKSRLSKLGIEMPDFD